MAHTKAKGKVSQKTTRPGKRLGIKITGGQNVKIGDNVVRQRGTGFHSGDGTRLGRDFTIYAVKNGVVHFKQKQGKKIVVVA